MALLKHVLCTDHVHFGQRKKNLLDLAKKLLETLSKLENFTQQEPLKDFSTGNYYLKKHVLDDSCLKVKGQKSSKKGERDKIFLTKLKSI